MKKIFAVVLAALCLLGDPICMFAGDNVYWSVSRNLPKTTELVIDGKIVYVHRANFSIVDTAVFE